MRVIKRSGDHEDVSFDKVLNRIKLLSADLNVDVYDITQKVCSRIYDGVLTSELDEFAAQICSSAIVDNLDYDTLASRIVISNHHKNTSPSFSETVHILKHLLSDDLYNFVMKNKEKLNSYIDYTRDYGFDYFGFKTLERSYLLKHEGRVVERPQHMFMRVAIGIHGNDLKDALQTYDLMSKKYFTHATPTLFNAGTRRPQMSSCFLGGISDDLEGIYDCLKECAMISKYAGGIGIHVHDIRAKGSLIKGTNGVSSGLIPMLKVFNYTARYVDQAGKRNGSIACFLEPWHADVEGFLDLKKNTGNEDDRARDLFYALWIPDLFMERVKSGGKWSLMCPDTCQGLSDVWGEKFNKLYTEYESKKMFVKQVNAQDLWFKILESQIETGTPYLMYKDACNAKSNQQNLGTIKSSNLCVAPETMVLTDLGYFPIHMLCDTEVNVWNGKQFSKVTVKQTGAAQSLLTVTFDNGISIRCTPYHKFYVVGSKEPVSAYELMPGQQLQPYALPSVETDMRYEDPKQVPINGDQWTKMKWITDHINEELEFYSDDPDTLFEVYLMLQTIGVQTKLDGNKLYMPVDYDPILSIKVEEVADYGDRSDTYCFTEPFEGKGTFNGIVTGNCVEIIEYSTPEEWACCNLSSICLPTFVDSDGVFDYDKLHEITAIVTKNLNKIIDGNYYPLVKAQRSNFKHRPIGIGVQGLADVFIKMRIPYDSEQARKVNKLIFETIYYGALEQSMLIAKKRHQDPEYRALRTNAFEPPADSNYPGAYSSFEGSPASQGKLQFDLWGVDVDNSRYDWDILKADIMTYGLRNSLLLAPMPTASTSQIMGFNESCEPMTSNIYKRKTLAGEFIVASKALVNDLVKYNLWSPELKNKIIMNEGSIANIPEIPQELRELYKTVWELSQKSIIDMAADRGAFICQSQSMNLFMDDPDFKKLTSMHFYAWTKGLKTGCYYLRTKTKAKAQKFTIEPEKKPEQIEKKTERVCVPDDEGICLLCSS